MIFNRYKTSASLCGSKYVQLQLRILITYHYRRKINKKLVDCFFTSVPILSSAEIKTIENHILLFLNI